MSNKSNQKEFEWAKLVDHPTYVHSDGPYVDFENIEVTRVYGNKEEGEWVGIGWRTTYNLDDQTWEGYLIVSTIDGLSYEDSLPTEQERYGVEFSQKEIATVKQNMKKHIEWGIDVIERVRREAAEECLMEYRDLYNELKPMLDRLDEVKRDAQDAVRLLGANVDIDGAKATIKSPYTSRSADYDGLEQYAKLVDERVKDYITYKEVTPSPSIRVL